MRGVRSSGRAASGEATTVATPVTSTVVHETTTVGMPNRMT